MEGPEALEEGRAQMEGTSLRATQAERAVGGPEALTLHHEHEQEAMFHGINPQIWGSSCYPKNTPSIQMKHLVKFVLKGLFLLLAAFKG